MPHINEAAERIRKLHPYVAREIKQGVNDLVTGPLAGYALRHELAGLRSYSGPDVHLSDS